jgi:hypothetical protein
MGSPFHEGLFAEHGEEVVMSDMQHFLVVSHLLAEGLLADDPIYSDCRLGPLLL